MRIAFGLEGYKILLFVQRESQNIGFLCTLSIYIFLTFYSSNLALHFQDCTIFIMDHTDTVTIDDCINCQLFIGPCAGRYVHVVCHVGDCNDKNWPYYMACSARGQDETNSTL